MTNFDINELSAELLISAYAFYHYRRIWKLDFIDWVVTLTPLRDDNNKITTLLYEYVGKYGPDKDWIHPTLDKKFMTTLINSLN